MTSPALLWPPRQVRQAPSQVSGWIDVSNWQGALSPGWFEHWAERGFGGLIVQAITGSDNRSYTRSQLLAAQQAGWEIAGYIWCNAHQADDLAGIERRLDLFNGFTLDFLALDVEAKDTQRRDVDTALPLCDAYTGKPTWLYTAHWVFEREGWLNVNWWASRPLWDAQYDEKADIDTGWRPYGGWTSRVMKQYSETPVDQNVRRR